MQSLGFRAGQAHVHLHFRRAEGAAIYQRTDTREELAGALVIARRVGGRLATHELCTMTLVDHLRGHRPRDGVIGLQAAVREASRARANGKQSLVAHFRLEALVDTHGRAEDVGDRQRYWLGLRRTEVALPVSAAWAVHAVTMPAREMMPTLHEE